MALETSLTVLWMFKNVFDEAKCSLDFIVKVQGLHEHANSLDTHIAN